MFILEIDCKGHQNFHGTKFYISVDSGLLHRYNTSEPDVPTRHMLVRFVHIRKREFLNHAVDFVKLCKVNSLFAVKGMS